MRTKAVLCAAAIAAGALSTWAQSSNVYSLNIVGYANVATAGANQIWANPLSTGSSNGANEVFSFIPDSTIFNLWNHNLSKFTAYLFDSSAGICANNWYQSDAVTCSQPPLLPPGVGFFINPGSTFTNVFVGNVVPNPNQTNTIVYGPGNYMVGSALPVGGYLTNTLYQLSSGNSPAANQMPDSTIFNQWSPTLNKYTAFLFDSSIGIAPDGWYKADGQTPGPPPNIAIGEGFFVNWGGSYNWAQTIGN